MDNAQVVGLANSTHDGDLSMQSTHNSCSVVVYRVYKPLDNRTIYIIQFTYSWELLPDTGSANGFLPIRYSAIVIGMISIVIIYRFKEYKRKDLPDMMKY